MQLNVSLQRSVLALVFLFPMVAASVRDGGSTIFILLFVASLFLGWPYWRHLERYEKKILIGYIIFFVAILLSLINTDDLSTAGRKLERYLRILAIVPVYLLLRRTGVATGKALVLGSAVGCLVMAAQAWYFHYIIGEQAVSGAYHKIVFGDTAVLLTATVAIGLMYLAHKWWQFLLGFLCIFAGLYASLLSDSRQAWLVVPFLAIVWLWMHHKFLGRRGWLVVGGVGVVIAIVGTLWMPNSIKKGFDRGVSELEAYQHNPNTGSSWGARLNMWQDAWTMFKQSPLLGKGIGDYTLERKRLMDAGLAREGYAYGHAHSIYMDSLATTGIIGTLAMLAAIFYLPLSGFFRIWRHATTPDCRLYALGGISAIVAFAAFGFSEGWLGRNPFVNVYAMFFIVFMSSATICNSNRQNYGENDVLRDTNGSDRKTQL